MNSEIFVFFSYRHGDCRPYIHLSCALKQFERLTFNQLPAEQWDYWQNCKNQQNRYRNGDRLLEGLDIRNSGNILTVKKSIFAFLGRGG